MKEANRMTEKRAVSRQNSSFGNASGQGAAVQTIDNILNSVNDTVNRLSDLQLQIAQTPKSKRFEHSTNSSRVIEPLNILDQIDHSVEKNEYGPGSTRKLKRKKLLMPNFSNQAIQKKHKASLIKQSNKIIKPKAKTSESSGEYSANKTQLSRSDKSAKNIIKVSTLPESNSINRGKCGVDAKPSRQHLVELFHNQQVKESDSGGELENKTKIEVKVKTNNNNNNYVPPIFLTEKTNDRENCDYEPADDQDPLISLPRTVVMNASYALPTIASKLKQVYKLGCRMFNFKTIPFCPTSSTSPSHNIGINIQQVMSILKNRQQVQGISPTLAHNIGLAAERLSTKASTGLTSNPTERGAFGRNSCPLAKNTVNYSYLQEKAKHIPDDIITEENEETERSNKVGPSGDEPQRDWTMRNQSKCTCIPHKGVNFDHVFKKYRMKTRSTVCQKWEAPRVSENTPQQNSTHIRFKTQRNSNTSQRKIIRCNVMPLLQPAAAHNNGSTNSIKTSDKLIPCAL